MSNMAIRKAFNYNCPKLQIFIFGMVMAIEGYQTGQSPDIKFYIRKEGKGNEKDDGSDRSNGNGNEFWDGICG